MYLWLSNPEEFRIRMCGLVRAAMRMIRTRRHRFVASHKPSATKPNDVVTDVDHAVQEFLGEHLRELFPEAGIIGEEGLFVPCPDPARPVYWTVDPLDGTMEFAAGATHGFSVMLSLVDDGKVVAACVGDVMSSLIYWFAPGQDPTCEDVTIDSFDVRPPLMGPVPAPESSVLVFGSEAKDPKRYHAMIHFLCSPGQVFGDSQFRGGSIGLRVMRMLRGEVSAIVLPANREWTPWDHTPIKGFCDLLGFRAVALRPHYAELVELPLLTEPAFRDHSVLLIHGSKLGRLQPWFDSRTGRP